MHKNRMTAEEALLELEPILYSITYGLQAVGAIHTAMVEGNAAPENFMDALYYVWDSLTNHAKEAVAIASGALEKPSAESIVPADWPTVGEAIRQAENSEK